MAVPGAAGAATSPSGRIFELVSASAQGVGDVERAPVMAEDGNAMAYMSLIGLPDAGATIVASTSVARRTAAGWASTDANLPATNGTSSLVTESPLDATSDLQRLLYSSTATSDPQDADHLGTDLYRWDTSTHVADFLTHSDVFPATTADSAMLVGASRDMSRVVFTHGELLIPDVSGTQIYVRDEQGVRLVSRMPDGTPAQLPSLVAEPSSRLLNDVGSGGVRVAHGGRHAVSDDGQRVYFQEWPSGADPSLYLWDHDHTVLLSGSRRSDSLGAARRGTFIAASHDGGIAFFDSRDQLTEDAPVGGGIYRYDVDADDLELLIGAPGGQSLALEDQAATSAALSDDLSHLYFVTQRALTPEAQEGNYNVYVWTASGGTRYITSINFTEKLARVSRNGRYLLLRSSASLNGAANDGHAAIYEYDAVQHTLTCISCRPDGTPNQGDANLDAQPPMALQPGLTAVRNLTDDGRVFFATKDQLVRQDVGAGADIYEFHDGKLSMVTAGNGDEDSYLADNTDDGRDVFFFTRDRLVAGDPSSESLDLYDARVGGGFAERSPSRSCEGDDCQGGAAARPQLAPPASIAASGRGNVDGGTPSPSARRSIRLAKLTPAQRRQLARTGRVSLEVRVTGGGTVTVRVKTSSGATLGSGRRSIKAKGTVTAHVTLRLTRSARRQVSRRARTRVTIEAVLKGVSGVRRTTVTLTSAHR